MVSKNIILSGVSVFTLHMAQLIYATYICARIKTLSRLTVYQIMFQYPIHAKTEVKETKKTAKQLRLPLQNTC